MSEKVQDWRTLQVFLSSRQPAIYEVELELDSQATRCSCPTFKGKRNCRHITFVKAKMLDNGGNYPMLVREQAEEEDIKLVMASAPRFREFVVKYGRVEVL